MKIERVEHNRKTTAEDISPGEVFTLYDKYKEENTYCIMTNDSDSSGRVCVRLADGKVGTVRPDAEVTLVDAKAVVR